MVNKKVSLDLMVWLDGFNFTEKVRLDGFVEFGIQLLQILLIRLINGCVYALF